jgi:hypothetical protein
MNALTYVIGDEFAAFADGTRVLTASQAEDRLATGAVVWDDLDLEQGLGLSQGDCDAMQRALSTAGAPPATVERFQRRTSALPMTHKRESRHILIGPPRRIEEHAFAFALVLDAGVNDRLCDHVTGCHVSGMLLIEAARQAVSVSLEGLYNVETGNEVGHRVAAWDSIKVAFRSFVFPLPVTLQVRSVEDPGHTGPRIPVTVTVSAIQLGEVVAEIEFHMTITSARLLRRIEGMGVNRALTQAASPRPSAPQLAAE